MLDGKATKPSRAPPLYRSKAASSARQRAASRRRPCNLAVACIYDLYCMPDLRARAMASKFQVWPDKSKFSQPHGSTEVPSGSRPNR
jgi:hypothetical protein